MKWRLGLAALLAAAAAPTAGATRADRITNPDWLQRPTADDLADYYPKIGTHLDIEGRATIACEVSATGALVDCEVVSEAPRELGFGLAALSMSKAFRMRPMTVNGKPVDGGTVRIPLRFSLPPRPATTEPPPPLSESALGEALRVVDALAMVDETLKGFRAWPAELAGLSADEAPPRSRDAAVTALREAGEDGQKILRVALARAYASVFSEGELKAMADHAESPGGRRLNSAEFRKTQEAVRNEFIRTVRTTAAADFCAARICATDAEVARMFAPAPRGNRLDAPAWTREPPAAAVDRVRPRIAWALGSPGAARLRCRVARTGRVDDCDVEAELPLGLGFGAAAQRLTAFYRLSEEEAARSRGRAVTLRVKFPPPPVEAPFEAPPAPSAKRLELARRLVDEQAVAAGRRAFEFEILELTSRPPRGTDPKVLDAALEAYRAGANKAISRMVDQFVAVHAAALNEGELEALAAYQKSPAAVAQTERLRPLAVELGKAARYGLARIQDDARARFCKTVDCVVAPPAPAPAPPSPTSGNSGR